MAAGIEENDHAFYGGMVPAWHGLGTVISEDIVSAKEALKLAHLDWEIEQIIPSVEIGEFPSSRMVRAVGYRANVRKDTGDILAIVKDSYVPVQNVEAFAFIDDLMGGADLRWHVAGSLHNGRKVWALARMDKSLFIGGSKDEQIDPYICIATSHDGSLAMSVHTTPVRVVCQNTLSLSLKNAKRIWRAKHSSQILSRVDEARRSLRMAGAYMAELQTMGDELIAKPLSQWRLGSMIDTLIPMPNDLAERPNGGKRMATVIEKKRALVWDQMKADNLANVKETAWGFLQGVIAYEDHSRGFRSDERRADRILFGADKTMKDRALEMALAY